MHSVTLKVASWDEVRTRFVQASKGKQVGHVISFATAELLFKTLAGKRWQLLQTLTGKGPVSIREAARLVSRDVKAVHTDVHTLLDAGLLDRTDEGLVVFPYDTIHVDFVLRAA